MAAILALNGDGWRLMPLASGTCSSEEAARRLQTASARGLFPEARAPSQPGSPHAADQLPLFANKQLRPVWRTRKEIEANLSGRKVFRTP